MSRKFPGRYFRNLSSATAQHSSKIGSVTLPISHAQIRLFEFFCGFVSVIFFVLSVGQPTLSIRWRNQSSIIPPNVSNGSVTGYTCVYRRRRCGPSPRRPLRTKFPPRQFFFLPHPDRNSLFSRYDGRDVFSALLLHYFSALLPLRLYSLAIHTGCTYIYRSRSI